MGTKITALTANTALASGDILPIVDDPGGSPVTKKITIDNLLKALNVLTALTNPDDTADELLIYDTSASTAKKITVAELLESILTTNGDILYRNSSGAIVRLGIGSSGNVLAVSSGLPAWGAVAAQMFLSAAAAVPKTTAGCAAAAPTEMTTNKQNLKTLDFDKDTEEHADFTFALPSDYDGGTMTAKFLWMHPATTVNFGVVWGIEGRCYANDDALDQAVGTAQTVVDTGGTTNDVYISDATGAVTWAGTPAANQLINLTVYRKAADGSDTLAVDAKLIGVQLTYTRS